jgi:hypothetical protein
VVAVSSTQRGLAIQQLQVMKSRFGRQYMVMGSSLEECGQRRTQDLFHATLRGFGKGMMALFMIMVAISPGKRQEVCGATGDGGPGTKTTRAGCGCSRPCREPAESLIAPLWWILGIAALITALSLAPKSLLICAWFFLCYVIMSPIR